MYYFQHNGPCVTDAVDRTDRPSQQGSCEFSETECRRELLALISYSPTPRAHRHTQGPQRDYFPNNRSNVIL